MYRHSSSFLDRCKQSRQFRILFWIKTISLEVFWNKREKKNRSDYVSERPQSEHSCGSQRMKVQSVRQIVRGTTAQDLHDPVQCNSHYTVLPGLGCSKLRVIVVDSTEERLRLGDRRVAGKHEIVQQASNDTAHQRANPVHLQTGTQSLTLYATVNVTLRTWMERHQSTFTCSPTKASRQPCTWMRTSATLDYPADNTVTRSRCYHAVIAVWADNTRA